LERFFFFGVVAMLMPSVRPVCPLFSSGPCAKRPGWSPEILKDALLGRSHRSTAGRERLRAVIDKSRDVLSIPQDYWCAIVPASDTGAIELALWSMLGQRGVDILAWESFGQSWVTDVKKQLKLEDCRVFSADYGALPDLSMVDCHRDVVLTWNGTTSGVKVPDGDWIAADREGLVFADATSAVFAMALPWQKLDVVTWSWQKVMGGEAAHGMIVLSPRAVQRLESHSPPWPLPKIFRLVKGGKLDAAIFKGDTINTPSMLCVEDALDGLQWAVSVGGLDGLIQRSMDNFRVIEDWVAQTAWVDFLAIEPKTRSNTSVCLKVVDETFMALSAEGQAGFIKAMVKQLEAEGVAYDVASYRDAPPGLRIWAGATIEKSDVQALLPWLDWAFDSVKMTSV
jgi:phosphoserine aminotransferase